MKKIIFALLLVVVIALAFSGCKANVQKAAENPDESQTEKPQVSGVTQDDLDKLKAGIEGIETEDIGPAPVQ